MFDIHNPHQFFETYDDHHLFASRYTIDLINRKDGKVWIMNHFFVNPEKDFNQELAKEMPKLQLIAQKSGYPIWPLDPGVIAYFKEHSEYYSIWYHKPFQIMD